MAEDGRVPSDPSKSNQWHHLAFDFMIGNYDIDWAEVDPSKIVSAISAAIVLTTLDNKKLAKNRAKVFPQNFSITKLNIVTDEGLHRMIDETED